MTISDDEQDIEQDFYASSESETTGRDAASSKSTFQVEIDIGPTAVTEADDYDEENYSSATSHDTTHRDYVGRKYQSKKITDVEDIRLYGAKDFSKKIKEELGISNVYNRSLQLKNIIY